MTERGQRMLKSTVCRSLQLSGSIAKDVQTSCGFQISTTVHRELPEMGFYSQAAASKLYIKCNESVGCSGVK
ncbi:unnamed protein product [Staurois parvus]|uniref:Uncharacterized protein n=1 Tax=Staurois parvus TaxID=386267 RepID=A0ABN9G2H0_9NEOB|nr:unnamed protein product [Staurois parvus]